MVGLVFRVVLVLDRAWFLIVNYDIISIIFFSLLGTAVCVTFCHLSRTSRRDPWCAFAFFCSSSLYLVAS